ncbi:MAG: UDP-3-O-(3-hydroxymyristoyl)glucosamine N-acyltransferase [Phycisphaerales bacterium]
MTTPATPKSATLDEIARLVGATMMGASDLRVDRVESLATATPGSIGFLRDATHAQVFFAGRCSAVLIPTSMDAARLREEDPLGRPLLIVPDADLALIKVLGFFAPVNAAEPGTHPTAVVHPEAVIDPSVSIGPYSVVGAGAVIAAGTVIREHCSIGKDVRIGARTWFHPGVRVLDGCRIGNDCILHSGAVVGSDGFGYHPSPDGRGLLKVPHLGNVEIHDDVEIGANSTIDRAKFGSTVIGAGTKIDNLVQIGHGCKLGRCCVLCGQAGLAGSVTLGDGVVLGGQVGVADGLSVGAGAKVAGGAGVSHDVPAGASYMGRPAQPAAEFKRNTAAFRSLGPLVPQIKRYFRTLSE